jgi:hypothetical protein
VLDDDQVWSTPSEVTNLVLSHVGDFNGVTTLSWAEPVKPGSASLVYDVLRSVSVVDFVTVADCVESDDGPDTMATDLTSLGPGEMVVFLVRAGNLCGQSPLGRGSNGAYRPSRDCP